MDFELLKSSHLQQLAVCSHLHPATAAFLGSLLLNMAHCRFQTYCTLDHSRHSQFRSFELQVANTSGDLVASCGLGKYQLGFMFPLPSAVPSAAVNGRLPPPACEASDPPEAPREVTPPRGRAEEMGPMEKSL